MLSGTNAPYVIGEPPSDTVRRSFPKLKGRQRRPLPAHRNRTISGLEQKFQETLGAKKQLQEAEYEWRDLDGYEQAKKYYDERLRRFNETLDNIEKSILMFEPEWPLTRKRHMEPKIKKASPLLGKTVFKRAFIQVLREMSAPLEVREIAVLVADKLDLPTHRRDQRQRVWNMTYGHLRSAYDRGYVECLDGKPAKWVPVPSNSHFDGI